ncbi:hypothetical protein ABBQ38_010096 [Trebouxia sp. C0009 RCD-2024]
MNFSAVPQRHLLNQRLVELRSRNMRISCLRRAPKLATLQAIATRDQVASQQSKLQHLYQQAQKTFGGGKQPNSPEDLQAVTQALREIPLQELAMQAPDDSTTTPSRGLFGVFHNKKRPPPITYIHIFEDQTMSIGIFCLPRNAIIPLHNHPNMVVLSRVLYGQLHVRSYDWASTQHTSHNGSQQGLSMAKLVLDEVVAPTNAPAVIFPSTGGNIHQFTAVTDCAVLDILAPPYSPQGGRDCTYYKANNDDQQGHVHLVESDPYPALNMQNKSYGGVRIQPAVAA